MTEQEFDELMNLLAEAHEKRTDELLSGDNGRYTESGYDPAADDYALECKTYCNLVKLLEQTFGFTSKV